MEEISDLIQVKSNELGLSLIGITDPSQPAGYTIFKNWLAQKHYGTMNYLNTQRSRELRENPNLLMPHCKSIIVAGFPNAPGNSSKNDFYGKLANFARLPDYHSVIRNKLNKLLSYIKGIYKIEVNGTIFCDSAPLLEKELAQRAGLGWIGKNSLLISSQFGSFFNLGELFLSIELPHSPLINNDLCGNCIKCVEACPTQCIQSDRTIDAGKCISYLTIEHKGKIDPVLLARMNSWMFGCDICQVVCPWNKNKFQESLITVSEISPFQKRLRGQELTEEQFFLMFGNSPVNRIKRSGFLRNYAIALGNSGSNDTIPDLIILINDDDPVIRIYSAWALGKIKSPQSKIILENRIITEKDQDVIIEIKNALTGMN